MAAQLTHEETLELIRAAKKGDESAKEKLVESNIALVKSIVRGFLGRGTDYDDLLQIGSIGLIKALNGYDPSFNVRFSTYAVPMISGEIKRFLRDDGIIKVSRGIKERSIHIFRAREELKNELLRDPELSEIAERTKLSEEEITEALEAVRDPISIYEPVKNDGDPRSALLIDTMPEMSIKEDVGIINSLMINQLLANLSEREKKIVLLRFFRDKTQSEIADIVGVSQVQISRIITRTLEKRKRLAEE